MNKTGGKGNETASNLEDLESRLDSVDVDEELDKPIEVTWSHPYSRNLGRSWRVCHAVCLINAVIENLPDDNEVGGELEDIASDIDNVEFPGMY